MLTIDLTEYQIIYNILHFHFIPKKRRVQSRNHPVYGIKLKYHIDYGEPAFTRCAEVQGRVQISHIHYFSTRNIKESVFGILKPIGVSDKLCFYNTKLKIKK